MIVCLVCPTDLSCFSYGVLLCFCFRVLTKKCILCIQRIMSANSLCHCKDIKGRESGENKRTNKQITNQPAILRICKCLVLNFVSSIFRFSYPSMHCEGTTPLCSWSHHEPKLPRALFGQFVLHLAHHGPGRHQFVFEFQYV